MRSGPQPLEVITGLETKPPAAGGELSEAKESGGEPPMLGDFCKFSIKITHFYAPFG